MYRMRLLKFFFCSLPKQPNQAVVSILSKTPVNHDCYLYQLKFVDGSFDLNIGEHFRIVETIKTYEAPEGEEVVRKYTPISPCSQKDVIDVLIKIYRPGANIKFPNGGKLTPYLEKLQQGDKVHLEGPFGKFGYQPGGTVILNEKPQTFKKIFFIAGGSGITPCYQVIREIINMPQENIELVLLFANKTEEDIVLRKELEAMQPRLKLHFLLDKAPDGWKGYTGYINETMLSEISPLNDRDTLYIYCGPFAMNTLIKDTFKEKYPDSTLFKF